MYLMFWHRWWLTQAYCYSSYKMAWHSDAGSDNVIMYDIKYHHVPKIHPHLEYSPKQCCDIKHTSWIPGSSITHHPGHVATPRTKDAVREGHTCTTFALHLAHCICSTRSMSPRSSHHITGAPEALDTAQPSPGQRSRFWESNSSRSLLLLFTICMSYFFILYLFYDLIIISTFLLGEIEPEWTPV